MNPRIKMVRVDTLRLIQNKIRRQQHEDTELISLTIETSMSYSQWEGILVYASRSSLTKKFIMLQSDLFPKQDDPFQTQVPKPAK